MGIRLVTRLSSEILAIDQKEVKLQGFTVPLDVGDRQQRFLISAVPPECPFCLPAGFRDGAREIDDGRISA